MGDIKVYYMSGCIDISHYNINLLGKNGVEIARFCSSRDSVTGQGNLL